MTTETVTALPTLPPRSADSNKGDFGRVLVVAGSRGMSGAAILCASRGDAGRRRSREDCGSGRDSCRSSRVSIRAT